MPSREVTSLSIHVAVRWRPDHLLDALSVAEVDVLRRHSAELLREVHLLQDADEPSE